MRRPRRNYTAAFKAKVAIAALKGNKTMIELTEKFDVQANQITQWKTQLLGSSIESAFKPTGGCGVLENQFTKRRLRWQQSSTGFK